jgi:hypothetical protein
MKIGKGNEILGEKLLQRQFVHQRIYKIYKWTQPKRTWDSFEELE